MSLPARFGTGRMQLGAYNGSHSDPVVFNTNGTVTAALMTAPQNWYSPTTVGIGSSFWVQGVAIGGSGVWLTLNGTQYSTGVTPWTQISSNASFAMVAHPLSNITVLVSFAVDSSGDDVMYEAILSLLPFP